MSESGDGDKKVDATNIPRGAINLKGVPVNRNARLPSFRSPRDLTLGTPAKRTFLPNIPVRRERKSLCSNESKDAASSSTPQPSTSKFTQSNKGKKQNERNKNIIQTEGSVFGSGIAPSSAAGYSKGSGRSSSMSYGRSGKGAAASKIKSEKSKMKITFKSEDDNNDNFIDDGDEPHASLPTFYPLEINKRELESRIKPEVKSDEPDSKEQFTNQNFAQEMGFDVKKIAQFIKKEKDEKVKPLVFSPNLPKNEVTELLTSNEPRMVLFQLPKHVTAPVPTYSHEKGQANGSVVSSEQKSNNGTGLTSLQEGKIGKLQIMKSGRVRLKIGDNYFNLDGTTKLPSKHQVASIQTEGGNGNIAILGNLEDSFSFVSDINNLVRKL